MKIYSCGLTDIGKVRTNNEDSFICDNETGLFVVADGMGGHNAGEVASQRAIETIHTYIKKIYAAPDKVVYGSVDKNLSVWGNHLASAIRIANSVVYQSAQNSPDKKGMGTTIAAVFYDKKKNLAACANVGDSRIYTFFSKNNNPADSTLKQITEDHTIVAEQLKMGMITDEEARKSQYQNLLSRALGVSDSVDVDVKEITPSDGTVLLVASDGLTRMVGDEDIKNILAATLVRPRDKGAASHLSKEEAAAKALIDAANLKGGRDNITVIIIRFEKESLIEKIFSS